MALTETPTCEFGKPAPHFNLLNIDGKFLSLQDCSGEKGTLIMFICNHCPFVKAIQQKLVDTSQQLIRSGVNVVAIMSNDTEKYPEDSFENMILDAKKWGYPFPYLLDDTQEIAKQYGAVCTPDYFGYNSSLELQYRGRLNATTPSRPEVAQDKQELLDAMLTIAETGKGPEQQTPSQGCSIKWKTA